MERQLTGDGHVTVDVLWTHVQQSAHGLFHAVLQEKKIPWLNDLKNQAIWSCGWSSSVH